MKAITVRLPDDIWKSCVHRLVDEESTWQRFLESLLEKYGEGEEIVIPAKTEKPRPKAR